MGYQICGKNSVENRLLAKKFILENLVKNSEFMSKLGSRYFTLSKIFQKSWKSALFTEILQISWI